MGVAEEVGKNVTSVKVGDQIGVPWLGGCCGDCIYCKEGKENLCDKAMCVFRSYNDSRYTGYQKNGGFADYCVANASFCFPIPSHYSPLQAAPLLCAGLIGYRSLRKTGSPKTLGLYGFGSSAHIIIQLANDLGIQCYVFTRDNDTKKQTFAKNLGATWVGGSSQLPPVPLDACIIFASEGQLVVSALNAIRKGGIVVCAGIHMTDIPSFPYEAMWNEKRIESVANLTVQDGKEFFELVSKNPLNVKVNLYCLEQANEAIDDLRHGRLTGSAVLVLDESLLSQFRVSNKHTNDFPMFPYTPHRLLGFSASLTLAALAALASSAALAALASSAALAALAALASFAASEGTQQIEHDTHHDQHEAHDHRQHRHNNRIRHHIRERRHFRRLQRLVRLLISPHSGRVRYNECLSPISHPSPRTSRSPPSPARSRDPRPAPRALEPPERRASRLLSRCEGTESRLLWPSSLKQSEMEYGNTGGMELRFIQRARLRISSTKRGLLAAWPAALWGCASRNRPEATSREVPATCRTPSWA